MSVRVQIESIQYDRLCGAVCHRPVRKLRRISGGRTGKAQAASLKKTQKDTQARLLLEDGTEKTVLSSELKKGNVVMVKAGEIIPGDGEVIEGIASVDESAITGESAPVVRESAAISVR